MAKAYLPTVNYLLLSYFIDILNRPSVNMSCFQACAVN